MYSCCQIFVFSFIATLASTGKLIDVNGSCGSEGNKPCSPERLDCKEVTTCWTGLPTTEISLWSWGTIPGPVGCTGAGAWLAGADPAGCPVAETWLAVLLRGGWAGSVCKGTSGWSVRAPERSGCSCLVTSVVTRATTWSRNPAGKTGFGRVFPPSTGTTGLAGGGAVSTPWEGGGPAARRLRAGALSEPAGGGGSTPEGRKTRENTKTKTRLVPQMNRDAMTSTWLGGSCDLRKTLIGGQLHCGSISPAVPRPSRNYSIHKQRKDIKILFPGKYLIYTVYTRYIHCTLCAVHYTRYTVLCALCTVHYTRYTVICALCTIHGTLYSVHCALYTVHWTQCTVLYTWYTVLCALCTVHGTLYSVHYTRYTVLFALYTEHCTLCPVH